MNTIDKLKHARKARRLYQHFVYEHDAEATLDRLADWLVGALAVACIIAFAGFPLFYWHWVMQ
jgi:hypothetical protein